MYAVTQTSPKELVYTEYFRLPASKEHLLSRRVLLTVTWQQDGNRTDSIMEG